MPKNLKQALLFILLVLPFSAFAHGEEILFAPLISIISTIIFSITILVIKPKFPCKLRLGVVYIVSTVISYALANLFPFRENMNIILILVGGVPIIMVVIGYLILKKLHNPKA